MNNLNFECESLIIKVYDDWFTEMEKGNSMVTVLLRLRRAFETIYRTMLVKKLQAEGTAQKQSVKY